MSETSPPRITRRVVLGTDATALSGCAVDAYAVGVAPVVPSRYAHAHMRERANLVFSGGHRMSIAPVCLGERSEIVVDLSSKRAA